MTRFVMAAAVMITAVAPARADDLDDFLNAVIRQRNIPGLAVAVVKDGRDAALDRQIGAGIK